MRRRFREFVALRGEKGIRQHCAALPFPAKRLPHRPLTDEQVNPLTY